MGEASEAGVAVNNFLATGKTTVRRSVLEAAIRIAEQAHSTSARDLLEAMRRVAP